MSLAFNVLNNSIKSLTRVLCAVDDSQLVNVPQQGPLIIVSNHINFMEIPLVYTHLQPRQVTGFAKAETWDNPVMGLLFDLWGAIPLQRGEADTTAFKLAIDALDQGKILAITPEGTRSGTGRLGKGHPGIVTLVRHRDVPILPLAFYGSEKFFTNINRLRRTDFHIRVGRAFRLVFPASMIDRDLRGKIVDEIMYQLAILLPAENRGYYTDLSNMSDKYLNFV
jgi:1-acyl-sn-glycerol-3-phosphate acyltransferase